MWSSLASIKHEVGLDTQACRKRKKNHPFGISSFHYKSKVVGDSFFVTIIILLEGLQLKILLTK